MISTHCVVITQPTVAGTQEVPIPWHYDFDAYPRLIFAIGNHSTTGVPSPASAAMSYGVAASTSDQRCISTWSEDNVAATDNGGGHSDALLIRVIDKDGVVKCSASVSAIGPRSFTLNWVTVDATARRFFVYVVGGPGVSHAETGALNAKLTTGIQSISVSGGLRDGEAMVWTFTGRSSTTLSFNESGFAMNAAHFGVASSAADQIYSANHVTNGTNPASTIKRQISGKIIGLYDNTAMFDEAAIDSFTSSGFDLNWTTSSGAGQYVFYAILVGPQCKVKTFSSATAIGNQSVSGIGFVPRGTGFQSVNGASSASNVPTAYLVHGAGISSAAQATVSAIHAPNFSPTRADSAFDGTSCYAGYNHSLAGAIQIQNVMRFVSNDADGITGNWVTALGIAREIAIACIGDDKPTVKVLGLASIFGNTTVGTN